MLKLSDTQLVILSTAARRQAGAVQPLLRSLKVHKAAATTVLKSCSRRTWSPSGPQRPMRHTGENGRRRTLVIADTGLLAIGIASDEVPSTRARDQAAAEAAQPARRTQTNCLQGDNQ